MAGTLYVGTSGFAYPEWKGPFYPADLRAADMLSFYAGRFRSVEINYTFRRHPAEKTLAQWRDTAPDGFVFVLKAHQRITHTLRLANAAEAVAFFLERARALGSRLGPVLFQCPPTLRHDPGLLEGFLAGLPTGGRFAFEFRHPSWAEARDVLASAGAAWCVSDTDVSPADEQRITGGPFAYLRLRRERYDDDELRAWAGRIRGALDEGDVFCFVKHEEAAAGPAFAARIEDLVASG